MEEWYSKTASWALDNVTWKHSRMPLATSFYDVCTIFSEVQKPRLPELIIKCLLIGILFMNYLEWWMYCQVKRNMCGNSNCLYITNLYWVPKMINPDTLPQERVPIQATWLISSSVEQHCQQRVYQIFLRHDFLGRVPGSCYL